MKKIYAILIAILLSNTNYGQGVLSFKDAVDVMLHHNKEIKVKEKNIETGTYNLNITKSLSYPQLKAFGTATWMNKDVSLDLNNLKDKTGALLGTDPATLGDWNFTLQKKDIQFAGVSLSWPIYTGGKIKAAQRAAKIDTDIRMNDKTISEQKLVSELAETYFQCRLADEAEKVRESVSAAMQLHLHNAQKLEENGITPPSETLQAKVAAAEADRQVLAARKDVLLSKDALASTLGIDSVADSLTSSFFTVEKLESLDACQNMAENNYPQIVKLKLFEKVSEQNIAAQKANYFPDIAVTGQKIIASNNFPLVKNPLIAGIGVTYNLFDGFGRKNKIKSSETEKQALVLTREKAQEDIRTLVDKLYKQLQKDEEQINSLKVSVSLAEELVRVRSKGFSEGISSSVDMIDAETNLSSVKLSILQAYYDYDTVLARLYELCGISSRYADHIQ